MNLNLFLVYKLHLTFIGYFHIYQQSADTSSTNWSTWTQTTPASLWHLLSWWEKFKMSCFFWSTQVHEQCQILLILFWKAGICSKSPTLLMEDEEKGRDEEEEEIVFCSDVAAQESLLGQHQNLPLLKPPHGGRPVTIRPLGRRVMAKMEAGRVHWWLEWWFPSHTQTQMPPLILTPPPTSPWPWPCRQHTQTHTLSTSLTHTHHG